MVLGELGMDGNLVEIKKIMLCFWAGVLIAKENKIYVIVYKIIYAMFTGGKFPTNWLSASNIGLIHVV